MTPVKISKPSKRSTVIDDPIERIFTKAYDHDLEAINTPLVNNTLYNIEPFSSAKKAMRSAKKETAAAIDFEQVIETTLVQKHSSGKYVCSKQNSITEKCKMAPNTPLVNKNLKNVEEQPSTPRTRSTSKSSKPDKIGANLDLDSAKKDIMKNVNVTLDIETQLKTPASKLLEKTDLRSSSKRNVKSVTTRKPDSEIEIPNSSTLDILETPKKRLNDNPVAVVAPQTPLVNKHLQIGDTRSSARRNVRSAYAAKECEEKEIDSKASASTTDTQMMPSSKQTESEVASQTPVANKNSQVVEPRSSTRRNVKSVYATKVSDEKQLNSNAISTTIDAPKMRLNDKIKTSAKRSTRINKKDNSLLAVGEAYTQFETPKKGSDDKSITVRTVREPVTFEPQALSTPVFKNVQELKAGFSAKRDASQGGNAQKDSGSIVAAVDNSSTPRTDLAKPADIDSGAPATPLVNKNLRLTGTKSSAKRGHTTHDDIMGFVSKSLKLDTTEFKIDAETVGKDSITEQITPVINKSIRGISTPRSSARRNVKSTYATKVIEPSTSNIDLSYSENESNILKTTTSKLNEAAISAINQSKIDTAIESNGGEDPMNNSLGLTDMLKTPVVKKTLRKNAAKQKTNSKLAKPCGIESKVETITGNIDVDDSMNNSFGLTNMLKTPAVQSTYSQNDLWSSARYAKLNTKSTIQPLKSESDLSSPEKISEMLQSPVPYNSSLIVNLGSSTNNSKMVMLPKKTPNKKPIQVSSFVSTPSTSGISPNKATSSQISGQNAVKVLKRIDTVRAPQSSNKIVGQSPVKSQISLSIKGQTPVQMGNNSSGSFVPYLRPSRNHFVNQSPGKSSNLFSSTETPNSLQEMNNMFKLGKTYISSVTPNPIIQKSFANQSPAETSNALNSSFELPKTLPMIVKTPLKSVTERKSFTGTDGLYYRNSVKGSPSTISPMKPTIARPNYTLNESYPINLVSPKNEVSIRHKFTPNTAITMNKMPNVQYASQSTNARCRKIDFGYAGSQMEKHQSQVARNTPNTSQANSSYMMSSTQLSAQLLPSRISSSYTNAGQVSMQKGNFHTSIQILINLFTNCICISIF